ncbi:Pre-mRNA-splicing factor [Fasciola gigantica]|uniref:Pre-mRNA-splicing factor n=1 Tax=Fasciola gigantica TaxID=46835 RepID=A0A504YPJ3_FASGI|nr:Pre-mRNA-splicing factor [Fasciola gigantica]
MKVLVLDKPKQPATMDLLKAEIAKKRNYLESKNLVGENKYFKRSVLRQKEEEEYFAKSKRAKDAADDTSESSLLETNEEENLLLKKFEERSREEREKSKLMPRKEVVRLLRERNQPIRLFGESDYDTFQRLKRVQLLEPESKGMRNDLIAALDKVDDAEDEEFYMSSRVKAGSDSIHSNEPSALDVKIKENVLSESDINAMKLDLARYVVYREGTATDDATATVVAISKLTPVTITGELENEFRNTVTDHTLRYLKVLVSL